MADILTETLADVDHHRFVLEQNILRLRESLQLWQAWELEYEGMKEEIHKFKNNINQSDLVIKSYHPVSSRKTDNYLKGESSEF